MNRRQFLAATGATLALPACRGGDTNGDGAGGDLDTVATVAGLERLTVETYTTLRALAVEGRLGALIPPAVTEFVTTATGRHQEHLDTWNGILVAGGRRKVDAADAGFKPTVEAAMSRLADIPALITLAVRIEDHTAQTYLQALPGLTDAEVITTAARILVVDQQHQAFLRYLLGLGPVGNGTVRDAADVAPADPKASLVTW